MLRIILFLGTSFTGGAALASGMPQFDSSTFSSQSFWALVSFVLLMTLLKKYVVPGVTDVLDARSRKIEEDLRNAEQMRREAERTLAANQDQLNNAWSMATKIQEDTRLEMSRYREKAIAEVDEKINKKRLAAEEEIEQAKRRALVELKSVAADVAITVAEKLLVKHIAREDADAMVDSAMTQLKTQENRLH